MTYKPLDCLDAAHPPDVFLDLGAQPLANALVHPHDAGADDPTYELAVGYCDELGLCQLTVSVDPDELFSSYLYESSWARTVVDNAHRLVDRTVTDRSLGGDDLALEVGSNDGYLLARYQEHGVPVLGVDPAANIVAAANERGVPTRCAFFGSAVAEDLAAEGLTASVIHANNVIAHVPDVLGVMRGMATVLRPGGVVMIETPYVGDMIDELEFDTIYHEHLFYYSLTSISRLLERAGLTVVDVERIPIHGGSLRVHAAHPGAPVGPRAAELFAEEEARGMTTADFYRGFGQAVDGLLADLSELLTGLADSGATVAGYAAAAKATVLLNALGPAGRIPAWIADRNVNKQGRLVPGVRVPVVSPDSILAEQPDYLLICAWNFLDEILDQEAEYRARGGKFIVPVPEPRII